MAADVQKPLESGEPSNRGGGTRRKRISDIGRCCNEANKVYGDDGYNFVQMRVVSFRESISNDR